MKLNTFWKYSYPMSVVCDGVLLNSHFCNIAFSRQYAAQGTLDYSAYFTQHVTEFAISNSIKVLKLPFK